MSDEQHSPNTAVTKPEPPPEPEKGTSFLPVEAGAIGSLPADLQRALLVRAQLISTGQWLRRQEGMIGAALGAKTWGGDLEETTRRALVRWAREYGVDPATEIDILGTRAKPSIYLRAAYYLRRLADLVASGLVEYAVADHVHADPRLDSPDDFGGLADEATAEKARRRYQRVVHGIPDEAAGACVFRVKLRSMTTEITGANYCGGGTRTKIGAGGVPITGAQADPIGEVEPVKTAETRAARRCLRLVVAHVPVLRDRMVALEDEGADLSNRIATDYRVADGHDPEITRAVADSLDY